MVPLDATAVMAGIPRGLAYCRSSVMFAVTMLVTVVPTRIWARL